MSRPPLATAAPTDYAAYMRQYRAYRAGRGPNPGPRAAWEAKLAELAVNERLSSAQRGWVEIRDAVLDLGGISPNADYGWDSIPRPVYRVAGKPADLMALLMTERGGWAFECADDLIAALWARWETLRHAKEDS